MSYTLEQLEDKLSKLRLEYKNTKPEERKLIVIRGNLLKQQIEIYKQRHEIKKKT